MPKISRTAYALSIVLGLAGAAAIYSASLAEPQKPAAGPDEMGKYTDKDGNPTYNVKPDGTVDWITFSGFKRYHSECHVCHGPNGGGSSYAPALVDSVKRLSYDDFKAIIIQGKRDVNTASNLVMPSFGTNVNVVCFIDDIWAYLKAVSDGAIPQGRPAKKDPKTQAYSEYEDSCLGLKK